MMISNWNKPFGLDGLYKKNLSAVRVNTRPVGYTFKPALRHRQFTPLLWRLYHVLRTQTESPGNNGKAVFLEETMATKVVDNT